MRRALLAMLMLSALGGVAAAQELTVGVFLPQASFATNA
jgi:hypothetical protein